MCLLGHHLSINSLQWMLLLFCLLFRAQATYFFHPSQQKNAGARPFLHNHSFLTILKFFLKSTRNHDRAICTEQTLAVNGVY